MKDEYEKKSCYYCGDIVFIDSNNEDPKGNVCYYGDDSMGQQIITCPNHYRD